MSREILIRGERAEFLNRDLAAARLTLAMQERMEALTNPQAVEPEPRLTLRQMTAHVLRLLAMWVERR